MATDRMPSPCSHSQSRNGKLGIIVNDDLMNSSGEAQRDLIAQIGSKTGEEREVDQNSSTSFSGRLIFSNFIYTLL